MSDVVSVLATYPGLLITGVTTTEIGGTVSCDIARTPEGAQAFSWVAFVVDCKSNDRAELELAPYQFTLIWRDEDSIRLADDLAFSRDVWRTHEARN